MTFEVRIGCARRRHVAHFARAHFRGYERDRTASATTAQLAHAGGYWKAFGLPPVLCTEDIGADDGTTFGIEFLTEEIVGWLNANAPGWRMIDRKHCPELPSEAVYETLLAFPEPRQAHGFSRVWSAFLHERVVAHYRHEISALRQAAQWAVDQLRQARPDKRYVRARTFAAAERAHRRAIGRLRRLEHQYQARAVRAEHPNAG